MSSFAGWSRVKDYYGLRPPFDFRVAIPFLLYACLLGVAFMIGAFLFLRGDLNFGTSRFYFFLYLGVLLVVGALFSRARKLPYAILGWSVIELGLGLGSYIGSVPGGVDSVFPPNLPIGTLDPSSYGTIYHPLLQSVPQPNYRYTRRLRIADEETAEAAGVDVASSQGQEVTFVHNSLGLRGNELTADDLAKDLIFVYGGSTAYDAAVTQGQTWVERLQSELKNRYTVLNWGVNAQSTVEILLRTAFYQDIVGKRPVCAIYYIGWTDMGEAMVQNVNSEYANFDLLENARHRDHFFLAQFSPLLYLANALAVRRFDSVPFAPEPGQSPSTDGDERLSAAFAQNIKTIAAINKARGIKTIFIGQMYNKNWPDPTDLSPFVRGEDVRFKSIMKDTAASTGAKYIDAGIENFQGSDFIDVAHFVARGSRKFAALIARQVGDYCQ
jgi:hypothetical protein